MPVDELVEGESPSGLIIMHAGDPTWEPTTRRDLTPAATHLFLRVVAYLVFADRLAIPARYLLSSEPLFQAFQWLRPLVELGYVVPEQRAGVNSLEDLARDRRLDQASITRGGALDTFVVDTRSFRFDELSSHYRDILTADLATDGALRRTIRGAQRGRFAPQIDQALDWHRQHGDGTPERFAEAVAISAPPLRRAALRWAMARYYITPTAFDDVNTREVPKPARDLLVQGGALPASLAQYSNAEPAQHLSGRLEAQLPVVPVDVFHREYCDALLEVRSRHPEARRLFGSIREASQLEDAGRTLASRFASELNRQMRVRAAEDPRKFSLKASLASSALAIPLAYAEPVVSIPVGLALGVGGGLGAPAAAKRRATSRNKENRPWVLAIEEMDHRVREVRREPS